ncbi:MAG: metallopeptidase family protein [Alphaproteobacteria bacterium]|nr:metallopeptidase family protein [Alphaproteobacteria bacterium]
MTTPADWSKATPPTLADIEALADAAYRTIPEVLRARIADVMVQVMDFPDDETMANLECESPFELLGLYRGIDLTQQSVTAVRQEVDMIFLYRRPLLDYWCESGEPLADVVRHVMIHEIGHHFGYSDDDMDDLAGPL